MLRCRQPRIDFAHGVHHVVNVWHPWPRTPQLRAEREALSLIRFLSARVQPQAEWLAAIAADQTISEPVRQRALQFAREWKP